MVRHTFLLHVALSTGWFWHGLPERCDRGTADSSAADSNTAEPGAGDDGAADDDPADLGRAAIERSTKPVTLAVLGDTPYGDEQIADFPGLISAINDDPDVSRVVHVGDIGRDSATCSDDYYAMVAAHFATFADPLVYTPGDNEWTDCHRDDRGQYDPLERLSALRKVFFREPDVTLGGRQDPLLTQASIPSGSSAVALAENQAWIESQIVFATLHIVGSANGMRAWFADIPEDELEDEKVRRLAEVTERTQAALAWIDSTFELARSRKARGVVLFMQADTWPGYGGDGCTEVLTAIAKRAHAFEDPVLVVQGDTHHYKADRPLLSGDEIHGIELSVPNLSRLVVEGETTSEWLQITVDPQSEAVFEWKRIFR